MARSTSSGVTRAYRLQRRAESQAETRLRIVEAAIELHGTIGPSRTTMSAIAELAGVQRNTLYGYFPNDAAVGQACSSLWYQRNPTPDIDALARITDPVARLHAALQATDAYFERTHEMLTALARDMDIPMIWEATAPLRQDAADRRDVVLQGFRLRGARRERLNAAIELALDFETWRLLRQHRQLGASTTIDLLVDMVRAVA